MAAINDQGELDLLESTLSFAPFLPFSAALDPYRDLFTRLGWFRGPVVPPLYDSQKRGEAIPVYLNDQGLKFLRDLSRRVAEENEYAKGALENRVSFIAGKGFQYKVEPIHDRVPAGLVKRAQRIVDEFSAHAELGELEQELVQRGDVDGESFLRLFYRPNGMTEVRIVEPEHVITPPSYAGDRRFMFGVETIPGDVETVVAYHVIEDTDTRVPCRVPASEIVHIKCNARRTWKRGLPVFYSVTENLIRVERCLRNFAVMSQLVATYSVLRKHKGPASAVQAFRDQLAATKVVDPITGNDRNLEQALPGGVHDVPSSMEIEFPGSDVNVAGYVQTLQADLRAVGSRMVMPEYMISGDASNANYSSTMIAESPSVRKFERDQSFYANRLAQTQGRNPALLWRVLLHAERSGRLPRGACRLLKITAEGPNLIVRDKNQETTRRQTLNQAGILSLPTWAQEEGYDHEAERRQGAGQEQHQPGDDMGQEPGASPAAGDAQQDTGDLFGFTEDNLMGIDPLDLIGTKRRRKRRRTVEQIYDDLWRLRESCVPNKTGKGYHDSTTGAPCKAPGGDTQATPKQKAAARKKGKKAGKGPASSAGGKGRQPSSRPAARSTPAERQAANPMSHDPAGPPPEGVRVPEKGPGSAKEPVRQVSPEVAQEARKSVVGRVIAGVGGMATAAGAAAKRVGEAVWSRLPKPVQTGLAVSLAVGNWVHHKAESFRHASLHLAESRRLLEAVGKERGLSPEQLKTVQSRLKWAEFASQMTLWVPAQILGEHLGLGEVPGKIPDSAPLVGGESYAAAAFMKGAALFPLPTLAYIGYSGVRNPMALVRAAKGMLTGKAHHAHAHEAEAPKVGRREVEALCDRADKLGDEWYTALLAVALDRTGHDLSAALDMADAAFEKGEAPPEAKETLAA